MTHSNLPHPITETVGPTQLYISIDEVTTMKVSLIKEKMIHILPKFYKCLQILTGINFGFIKFESFKIKCIANIFSLLQVGSFSVACMIQTYNDVERNVFWRHMIYLIQNILYVLVFMFMSTDTTLAGCLLVFRNFDSKLRIDPQSYNLEIKNLLTVFVFVLAKIVCTFILCYVFEMCLPGYGKNMFYFAIILLRDLVILVNMFVFYVVNCRLTKFIKLLEMDNVSIISFHRLYKVIADIALKLKRAYDSVVS